MLKYALCALIALQFLLPFSIQSAPQREQIRQALRGLVLRYTRVEGVFTGYQILLNPDAWNGLSTRFETGYGTQNKDVSWTAGMGFARRRFSVGLNLFNRTDTNDNEIITTAENSIFALLYKGDDRDYFRAENGFEFESTYRLRPRLYAEGRLKAFTYESMPVTADWSLLRRDEPFRANPSVAPGRTGIVQLGVRYDTRRRTPQFRNAWHVRAHYEHGFREFAYDGLRLSVVRHQKVIWGNQAFIFQGFLNTRTHTAEQHLFDLGGVGTLRGFGTKEFTGNRSLQLSIDYLFRGDVFHHVALPGMHLLNLVVFWDTGWIRLLPKDSHMLDGFQDLNLNDFKSDMGIAIGITEHLFRLNIARRLDRSADAWTLSARFFREF